VSTRLIGALIMAHSDDQGLVMPPKLAPFQVVIIPFFSKNADETALLQAKAKEIKLSLQQKGIRVQIDDDDTKRPGFKFAEYELKGYPVRIVVGPRDLNNGVVEVARRDTKEKQTMPLEGLADAVEQLLADIQANIFQKALQF